MMMCYNQDFGRLFQHALQMISKDEGEEEMGVSNNCSYHTQTHIPILMCWDIRLIMFIRTVLHHPELNNTYSEGICALRRKSEQKVLLEKSSRESIQIRYSFSAHYTQSTLLGTRDSYQDNWQSGNHCPLAAYCLVKNQRNSMRQTVIIAIMKIQN